MIAQDGVDSSEVTLLVHDFTFSEGFRQRPKQQVLSEGLRLVAAGSFETCQLGRQIGSLDKRKQGNIFTYDNKPPVVSSTGSIPVVKEWGSSISNDEIFTVIGLDEFQTTAFIPNNDAGRQNTDIDTVSLLEIIPQPHLHPSPFLLTVPPPIGQPYSRNKPMFQAPYFNFSLPDHARVAWIIPIRGTLPWSGCTDASLFNVPMPSSVEGNLIRWNRASLLKFWQFLLDLQKSGSLGALGVSLHVVKLPKSSSSNNRRKLTITPDLLPQPMEHGRRCSTVDYFKIYHDASRTLYVRKAVDSWSYYSGQDGMKVRVLKGAKFPLLDEVSIAILVC